MFGSTVGFSGSADRMAIFRVGPNVIGMWENDARGVGECGARVRVGARVTLAITWPI